MNSLIKLILGIIIFLDISKLSAQIRQDFNISDSTSFRSVAVDSRGYLHSVEKTDKYLYFGSYDSLGCILTKVKIAQGSSNQEASIFLNDDYITFMWRQMTPAFNDYINCIVYDRKKHHLSEIIRVNDAFGDAYRFNPHGCFMNDTTFLAAWSGYGPDGIGVYGQIVTTSLKFIGEKIDISDHIDFDTSHGDPKILVLSELKKIIVFWRDNSTGIYNIYGRIFSYDGVPQDSSFRVSEDTTITDLWDFDVKQIDTGRILVVWAAEKYSDWYLQWRLLNNAGDFISDSKTVSDLISKPIEYADARMEVLDSGKIIIFYEGQFGKDKCRIFAKEYDENLNAITSDQLLSQEPDSSYHFISSTSSFSNKFYVFWFIGGMAYNTWAGVYSFDYLPIRPISDPDQMLSVPTLFQNYPNPFNGETVIKYHLSSESTINLVLYNLLGQKIKQLFSGKKMPGLYSIKLSGSGYPSGIYYYTLETDNYSVSRKCLILK